MRKVFFHFFRIRLPMMSEVRWSKGIIQQFFFFIRKFAISAFLAQIHKVDRLFRHHEANTRI